jgi:hypothetical protein
MASYIEMKVLFNDSGLKNRCEAAVIKAAYNLLVTDTTAEAKELIKKVFNMKEHYAKLSLYALVIANEDKTVDEIKELPDAVIQAIVDASAPLLKGM